MGASAVLIEKGRMGGDCLNYGCVPSKAMLAAGHAANAARRSRLFGVTFGEPNILAENVYRHIHSVIAAIAPLDSAERYRGFGVNVLKGVASFVGLNELAIDGQQVRARHFVIATGSVPAVPDTPGLDTVPYLTNETLFYSGVLPHHLIILGGGAVGIEMAQAHRNLGCAVTVLERDRILQKDDPELVAVLRDQLVADGVTVVEAANVTRFEKTETGVKAVVSVRDREETILGSHLLVAAGRRAFVEGLNLDLAGVGYTDQRVTVDERLRTSNKRIFAVGDVTGSYQYAHMAGYHASIVLKNALLRIPSRLRYNGVPWVTFTDPELAQVGLTESQARERYGRVEVFRWAFKDNDRAQAERTVTGFAKIVTRSNGQVVGAGIVGPAAGELIQVWILMIHRKMKISELSGAIFPYPTLGYVNKYVADKARERVRYGSWTRGLVKLMSQFD
jgi:pyruvate/2-oxoglutarate dehydrogenase complex dihydrolipoamide dehydrogenase (E3) component